MRTRVAALRDPWLLAALAALVFATLRLLVKVVSYQHLAMDLDEAVHARDGQEFSQAFRSLGSGKLTELLLRPQWHPPGHGALLGIWFAVFGSSVLAARLYAVLAYFLLGVVILRSAATLCERSGPLVWAWAVLLFATDSGHTESGGLSMLEAPAELFTASALLLFVEGSRRQGRRALAFHVAAAGFALLTFFTRYAHGLALIGALGAAHAVGIVNALRTRATRDLVAPGVFGFLVLASVSIWMFGFGQLRWFLAYSHAQPANVVRWSLENAAYYPRLLFESTPLGPLVLLAFVIGLVAAVRRRRFEPKLIPYLFYFALSFALLFFVRQKSERFGLMLSVPLWLLTLGLLEPLVTDFLRNRRRLATVATLLLGALAHAFYYRDPFPAAYENYDDGLTRAYDEIASVVRPWEGKEARIVLFGRDDLRSGTALAFALASACDRRGAPCSVTVEDEADLARGWPRGSLPRSGFARRRERALARATHVLAYGDPKQLQSLEDRQLLLDSEVTYRPRRGKKTLHVRLFGPKGQS